MAFWKLLVPTTVIGLALAASACGASDPSEGASGGSEGAALYQDNCSNCHGSGLGGTARGPSLLSVVYEPGHHPDAAIAAAIRNGSPQHHWNFGAMPPVPGLDDAQIDEIIAFVRAEQERQGLQG